MSDWHKEYLAPLALEIEVASVSSTESMILSVSLHRAVVVVVV